MMDINLADIMKSIPLKEGWALLALAVCLAASCGKLNPPDPVDPVGPDTVAAPKISLSGDGFVIYPASCSCPVDFSFSVVSDEAASVSVSCSGGLRADLSMSEDRKSGTVTVSALDGLLKEGNTVTVKAVNSGGEASATVDFTEAYLTIDRTSFDAKTAGASITLSVESNVGVKVDIHDDAAVWLHAKMDSGAIGVTVDRNSEYSARTGTVTVTDSRGLLERTFTVTQAAAINYAEEEREALVALWNATGGQEWKDLSNSTGGQTYSTANWCTDAPVDTWYGVTVNPDGHVIYLHLAGVGLKGKLPEEIGKLAFLQELWLGDNDLSGGIPESMGELQVLKDVSMSGMSLSGNLESSSLGNIASHLKNVSLSGNMFTGGFPEWVGDMPENANFWLQGNCLEGKVPEKVKLHPRWNAEVLDGSGRTVGQINMQQREGHVLE